MDVENIYQHFRKEEQPFIQQVLDWIDQVDGQYAPVLTPYLDPREQYIMQTLVASSVVQVAFHSAITSAERKRAIIYPDYYEVTAEDFEEKLFEIHYAHKFASINHSQILGSLMGAGIKRNALGDIITDGVRFQFALASSVAHYVALQIDHIGRQAVQLALIEPAELVHPIDESQIESTTIVSFRLDNVVANVYNISRQRAKQLVQNGRVKVNFAEVVRPDFTLAQFDIVSVRGFGRFYIKKIGSKTKKDRYRIDLSVLRK